MDLSVITASAYSTIVSAEIGTLQRRFLLSCRLVRVLTAGKDKLQAPGCAIRAKRSRPPINL